MFLVYPLIGQFSFEVCHLIFADQVYQWINCWLPLLISELCRFHFKIQISLDRSQFQLYFNLQDISKFQNLIFHFFLKLFLAFIIIFQVIFPTHYWHLTTFTFQTQNFKTSSRYHFILIIHFRRALYIFITVYWDLWLQILVF